jgi:hypothetical protein
MATDTAFEQSRSQYAKVRNASLRIGNLGEDGEGLFAGTTLQETMNLEPDAISKSRFCALAYAPNAELGLLPAVRHVILIIVQKADCALHILVHPNLKKIVDAIDISYIESLLIDFIERVNLHAAELFRHLCSLAVGPLQTETVGEQLCEHPNIHELALQFAAL